MYVVTPDVRADAMHSRMINHLQRCTHIPNKERVQDVVKLDVRGSLTPAFG